MATIASLIVNIAADTSDLRRNVEQMAGTMDRAEGMATKLGKTLIGAFTVTAVIAAGKQLLDFASNLSDLSQKTGISVTGLQKLDLAFKQNGISLETVTSASSMLANRLVSGDKSVVGALTKMGLSVDELKRMAPEQQFLRVADAVGSIANPTEKTYAAMQVFGRGGAQLLAGLTGNLQQTTAEFERMGLIVSAESVEAADQFGDQLTLLGRQLLGVAGQIVGPLLPALSALATLLGKIGDLVAPLVGLFIDWTIKGILAAYSAIVKFVAGIAELVTKIPLLGKHLGFAGDAANYLREHAANVDTQLVKMFTSTTNVGTAAASAAPPVLGLGNATETAAKAAEKAAAKWAEWSESVREASFAVQNFLSKNLMLAPSIQDNAASLGAYNLIAEHSVIVAGEQAQATREFNEELARNGVLLDFSAHTSNNASQMAREGTVATLSWRDGIASLSEAFGQLGQIGGDALSSLTRGIGTAISSINLAAQSMDSFKAGLASLSGGGFAGLLSGIASLTSGIGALIPLADLAWKGIKKLFGGPDAEEMEGRSVAAQFREQLEAMLTDTQKLEAGNERWKQSVIVVRDAYMAAGKSEQDALAIMDKLWKAEKQGGDAVRRVMEEIQAVLNAGLTPAATGFGTAMTDATTVATNGLTAMGAAAQVIKDQIAQPIVIPVEFEWSESERKAKSSGRTGLGPEDFASYDDWKKYFLENNPGDEHRAEDAYNSMHTGGVVDFAKWKRAHTGMLAHDEVPTILQAGEGVVRKEAMTLVGGAAGIEALNRGRNGGGMDATGIQARQDQQTVELAALRRELRGLPAAIKVAMQDANALAPRRRAS